MMPHMHSIWPKAPLASKLCSASSSCSSRHALYAVARPNAHASGSAPVKRLGLYQHVPSVNASKLHHNPRRHPPTCHASSEAAHADESVCSSRSEPDTLGEPSSTSHALQAGVLEGQPQPQPEPVASTSGQDQVSSIWQHVVTSFTKVPKVPWGTGKIIEVMVLWLLAYISIGHVALPLALSLLGIDRDELSLRGHALLHLLLDLSQLATSLGILWARLRQYQPLKRGLFPVRWRGWWPLLVLGCCCVFPGVDWLAQSCVRWFSHDSDMWATQIETSLNTGDWVTNVAYFTVVSLCAPIWEEAIFRGFLLPSLAKHMPVPAALAASSVLFALCHFRAQTFLPLLLLGAMFSSLALLCRNLLPPILFHSAWNMYVLWSMLYRPMMQW